LARSAPKGSHASQGRMPSRLFEFETGLPTLRQAVTRAKLASLLSRR
jgi:hypothetical protein